MATANQDLGRLQGSSEELCVSSLWGHTHTHTHTHDTPQTPVQGASLLWPVFFSLSTTSER